MRISQVRQSPGQLAEKMKNKTQEMWAISETVKDMNSTMHFQKETLPVSQYSPMRPFGALLRPAYGNTML